jgi:hypothetical protein
MIAPILTAFGFLMVFPLFESLLLSHFIMIVVCVASTLRRFPRYINVYIIILSILIIWVLLIISFGPVGNRATSELIKLILVCFTSLSLAQFPEYTRYLIYSLAITISVALIGYYIFSDNPLSYGDRLGIILDSRDEEKQISANTLGFIINFSIITILNQKKLIWKALILPLLFLLYLTFSRGAYISLAMIIIYFCIIKRLHFFLLFMLSSIIVILAMFDLQITDKFRLDDDTGSGRFLLYDLLINDLLSSPLNLIIGFGPGAINHEIYPGKVLISAHSGFFEILYSFGLAGISVLTYVFLYLFKNRSYLSIETKYYLILMFMYSLSEDLYGAHTLPIIASIIAQVVMDLSENKTNTFSVV